MLLLFNSIYSQSLYEIKFTDKVNNKYKALLVYFNDYNSYIRTGYNVNGKYNVVEVNYKMEYGTTKEGLKYCMLRKTSKPVMIPSNLIAVSYNPDYFIWFYSKSTGKYDDLYTTDDSTFNAKNYRRVDAYTPLKTSNITDSYLKEFFSTGEFKYSALKKMCGITPVILKPLSNLQSTKLHLVIIANTNDPSIGKSCDNDRYNLVNELQQTATALGIGFKNYIISGDNFSKSNLLATLNSIYPSSNDIVLFIYRGHGFRWPNQVEQWPRLALFYGKASPRSDNSNSINLQEIKNILDKKGARLNIVLGDCCNDPYGVTVMTSNNFFQSQVTAFTDVSKLRMLFLNSKGSIISAAAKPGEVSYAGIDGGYYTTSFITALGFETSYSKTGSAQWSSIFSTTIKLANNKSLYCDSRQNGISDVRISGGY